MGLKAKFTSNDVKKFLEERQRRIYKIIIDNLIAVGLQFVADARTNGNYLDQTGNLRSSIGFVVMHNGNVIVQNFEKSQKGTDRETGLSKAISFTDEIAQNYQKGFVLIVVAGMEYAAAVESKNKDVITGSSLKAKADLAKAVRSIKKMAKQGV